MRRVTALLGFLGVLVVLAVVGDRVAKSVAERVIAGRLADAGSTLATPTVHVHGFPFLTQAIRGRFDDVTVDAADVRIGTLRARRFIAELHGVRVPLSAALSRQVTSVPVDGLTSTAVLSYADLGSAVADRGLTVSSAGGGRALVTGRLTLLGQTLQASAVSLPTLQDSTVVVTAERYEVGHRAADAILSRALGSRLDFRLRLGPLPYGLHVTGLTTTPDGVVLSARSAGTVLRPLTP